MDFFLLKSRSPRDQVQSRLLILAAVFLFLFAVTLTLSPAARLHSWNVPLRWTHWAGFVVWLGGFVFLHHQTARLLPDRDPYFLPLAAILTGWGLLTIWRLDTTLGLRQTLWLALGFLIFWFGIRTPGLLALTRRYKYLELTGGLLLTALTFIFGVYPGGVGPHLWLGCCGFYLQPSEPLKLLLIVYLTAYLADHLPLSFKLMELLTPTLILMGAALVILIAQRDLGTATLFIFLYSAIVYMASAKRRILAISGGSILLAGLLGYQLFDVIRIRINAWINPWIDSSGRSYQIVQSLISIASGGVFGSGPGIGSPGLVPVAHSDFIFTAIAEETGLLGTLALVGVFALLIHRGFRTAMHATHSYQRYLAAGLSAYLSAQAILIIAGNIRLLPLTGVTLPFISYGGSSLLTSIISVLLLTLISSPADPEPAPLPVVQPYLLTASGLIAGLVCIALINGWWSVVRADSLVNRADNPRRFVAERIVPRGTILDRNNRSIQVSEGQPGSFTRRSLYPPLAATIGYTDPVYGQAGLEASQDGYLRGTQGSPASLISWNYLLYSQPPPGLNVRLSLDLDLQRLADGLIGSKKGALVLMNAKTGEILVMASHPYFDPNQISQNWTEWIQDKTAPLLNRATQGQYSPGTAIGPFLLSAALNRGPIPSLPADLSFATAGKTWTCAQNPPANPTWQWAVQNGCPAALVQLNRQLNPGQLGLLFQQLGFYNLPDIPLSGAVPVKQTDFKNADLAALGEENTSVTPLQMVLAASTLSMKGQYPNPRIVMAVQTPQQGWVVFPSQPAHESLSPASSETAARLLGIEGTPYWQTTGNGLTGQGRVTWYLTGTLPDSQGIPLALALVLEEDNPTLASQIGQAVLKAAQAP